jgi:hypothetical protein
MKTTATLTLISSLLLLAGLALYHGAPVPTTPPQSPASESASTLPPAALPTCADNQPGVPAVPVPTGAPALDSPTAQPTPPAVKSLELADMDEVEPAEDRTIQPPSGALTPDQVTQLKGLAELMDRDDGAAEAALNPLRDWAKEDPTACCQWVLDNLTGKAKERCLEEAIGVWSASSPTTALDWLDHQPTHEGNEGAFSTALNALGRTDAGKAAEWLQSHPNLGSLENWEALLNAWGESDPSKALSWVTQKLGANLREALLPNLLISLNGAPAVSSLLNGLSADARDAVLLNAIKSVPQGEASLALSIAKQLSDETARAAAAEKILGQSLQTEH